MPARLQQMGHFAARIAATCVEALYLEQYVDSFVQIFNETKQICASHTKRGGAMGFKFDIQSTYRTKSQ